MTGVSISIVDQIPLGKRLKSTHKGYIIEGWSESHCQIEKSVDSCTGGFLYRSVIFLSSLLVLPAAILESFIFRF